MNQQQPAPEMQVAREEPRQTREEDRRQGHEVRLRHLVSEELGRLHDGLQGVRAGDGGDAHSAEPPSGRANPRLPRPTVPEEKAFPRKGEKAMKTLMVSGGPLVLYERSAGRVGIKCLRKAMIG